MAATEKALISTAIGPGISQIAKPSNLGEPIIARIPPEERERLSAGRSFRLEHNLGHHPALSLDGIRDLVERMLTERRFDQIFYKTGKSMTTGRYADEERRSEILTVLENFDNSGVWLRLTRVDEVSPM